MSGHYKRIVTLLLVGLLSCSNSQTIDLFARNFCAELSPTTDDNFSCNDATIQEGDCISFSALCNGVRDCADGEDEGDNAQLSSLQCEYSYS